MRPSPRSETAPSSIWESLRRRLRDLAWGGEANGLRDSIEAVMAEAGEGDDRPITAAQRALLLNAIAFGELRVGDVMIPRIEIEAVPAEAGLGQVVAAMRASRSWHLVVYRETLDDVVGVLHGPDLLEFWGDGTAFHLEALVRPALVVPTAMPMIDLLIELQKTRSPMAIVVDEFGGTDGVVTVENVVQELVGDLHEPTAGEESPHISRRDDGSVEADARIQLEDLEQELGLVFLSEAERDDIDTLSGLLVSVLDRVPEAGETVDHSSGLRFEVLESDPRRVKRVLISGLAGDASGRAGLDNGVARP